MTARRNADRPSNQPTCPSFSNAWRRRPSTRHQSHRFLPVSPSCPAFPPQAREEQERRRAQEAARGRNKYRKGKGFTKATSSSAVRKAGSQRRQLRDLKARAMEYDHFYDHSYFS